MTDKATLGQNVPNMAEGLYLMDGIKGLLSLPQHSVDMLLTDPAAAPRAVGGGEMGGQAQRGGAVLRPMPL